jgi:hypothetical protein
VPAGQGVHAVAVPLADANVPTGQSEHADAPAALNWPAAHSPVHDAVGWFAVAPNDPALQFVHDAAPSRLY